MKSQCVQKNRNQLQSKSPFLKATFQQWLLWKSPYVFSLSECIDSLSLWRLYGDQGRGVAIALDRSELLKKCRRALDGTP